MGRRRSYNRRKKYDDYYDDYSSRRSFFRKKPKKRSLKKGMNFFRKILVFWTITSIFFIIFTIAHRKEPLENSLNKLNCVPYIDRSFSTIKKYYISTENLIKNIANKIHINNLIPAFSSPEKDTVPDENPDNIIISSFNIRILSDKSRNDKEIDYISDILKKYDITAIQEVRDEKVLSRIVSALKRRGLVYNYEISPKVGKKVKERYAFLYKNNKINLIKKGKIFKDIHDDFIREPFYAGFKAKNFDFTLATIHILFGKNEKERRPEIMKLGNVYKEIKKENPNEKDIILLGDFNFPPNDIGFRYLASLASMVFLMQPHWKSTIGNKSLYDNIWFQKKYVKEFTGNAGIFKFDKVMFNNNIRSAKKAVSDHRPIWGEFSIIGNDDD